MKILELLPELEEGGVERHVVALATALSRRKHSICVVSRGGKLTSALPDTVIHQHLPVQSKNPLTILRCAWQVAALAKRESIELMHAHARVPAWTGHIASRLAQVPLVITAHCNYGNRTHMIYLPFRRAARVICVSRSVEQEMSNCFSGNTIVVRNGLPPAPGWLGPREQDKQHLLFIGRLSQVKGLHDAIEALAMIKNRETWRLDVLGDGPQRNELEILARDKGLGSQIFFHGFRDDTDDWLQHCSCFIFPSYREGLSLTLARAIQIEVPIIASDIPSVRELCSQPETLIPPGDIQQWRDALQGFIANGKTQDGFDPKTIPTLEAMALETENVYLQAISPIETRR